MTGKTFSRLCGVALLCFVLTPVFILTAIWLRIKYAPLPPIPARVVRYRVEDRGTAGRLYNSGHDLFNNPGRLNADGSVTRFSKDEAMAYNSGAKAERAAWAKANGFESERYVHFLRDGIALVSPQYGAYEVRNDKRIMQQFNGKIADYRRGTCGLFPHAANAKTAVGHSYLATGCASSGGASEPHGRRFAVVIENGIARDLNVFIADSGWYLDFAVDINAHGQILCYGRKLSPRESESSHEPFRFLVLSPLK